MPRWQVQQDWEHWLKLSDWLNDRRRRQPLPLTDAVVSEAS
jgi:hypothetical protein